MALAVQLHIFWLTDWPLKPFPACILAQFAVHRARLIWDRPSEQLRPCIPGGSGGRRGDGPRTVLNLEKKHG